MPTQTLIRTSTLSRLTAMLAATATLAINFAGAEAPAPRHGRAKTPAEAGLSFDRLALKDGRDLSKDPGGPKERIEVQTTDDHIDYITKTYVLKYANADEVWLFIQNAIAKEGGYADRYAPGSNPIVNGERLDQQYSGQSIIVVTAPKWTFDYLDDTIRQLDRPEFRTGLYGNASLYVHPKHRKPSELLEHIAASASSGRQSFHADDSRNVLYIEDVPSYFAYALEALKQFDVPADQIDLSIRIYEIDDQDGKDVGIDWYTFKKSASGGGFDWKWSNSGNSSSYNLNLDQVTAELSFNPNLATEFLNFATDKGHAKVVTDSQVTLVNGKVGTVNALTQIPYVIRGWIGGKVADQPNLDSPTATDAAGAVREFDEGVALSITPTIGTDTISLDINAAVSSHVGYTPDQNVPIISTSSVNSVVVLESGKAALLGGLKRKRNVFERQGIPGLRDVDYIKYLFSHEVSRERESRILVTLRPTRVTPSTVTETRLAETQPAASPEAGVASEEPNPQPVR